MKFNYITTPEKARVEVDGMRRYQWGEKATIGYDHPIRSSGSIVKR